MRRYWDSVISIVNWLAIFIYFVGVHVQKTFFLVLEHYFCTVYKLS